MVKFRKPKRLRRVKKQKLKADDLIPLLGDDGDNDRSYRAAPKRPAEPQTGGLSLYFRRQDIDIKKEDDDDDEPDIIMAEEDLSAVVIEPDEAELELQMALSKARKLKQKDGGSDKVSEVVKMKLKRELSDESASKVGGIMMNSTAEFCRALGDIPTYGQAGNRDEEADELMDLERELMEERQRLEEEKEKRSAWNEVDMDEGPEIRGNEDAPILDEEPDIGTGIGGALQLAMKKGYLEKEQKKLSSAPRHSNLEAANYTIEDKARFEEEQRGRRERYNGPVSDFREKDTYKPDVKLEYIDDSGRLLNQKEAFRYLSHKFHGKGPGKNKVEKRMKKVQEEALMKRMSSTDTPLGTLALLQEKQRQSQSPFILLSGGSKALTLPTIAKQQ
jgi:U4/U6.U5 tri-snRNP-associated protein 1